MLLRAKQPVQRPGVQKAAGRNGKPPTPLVRHSFMHLFSLGQALCLAQDLQGEGRPDPATGSHSQGRETDTYHDALGRREGRAGKASWRRMSKV